jgi:hypothetical protein
MRTGRPIRYQSTFFQIQYAVAAPRERQIVGDEDRGELVRPVQVFEQLKNHLAGPEIQVAGRFIGK